ncbi:MAG: hypothetical protein RJA63_887 [Pseudomonadota bacterium]|jgi:hypothetical protein|nr:hypothetical protein [Uliginosibacterium sp.]
MNWWDTTLKVAGDYGISSVWILVLVAAGNFGAAWLAQIVFPMRLKKEAWKWEKEKWATEKLFESLSLIDFLGSCCIQSELEDRASMSFLGLEGTEQEIYQTVLTLHQEGHRIRPYLSGSNQAVLDGFLQESHLAVDADKEAHGHWGPKAEDDDEEERRVKNSINFIHSQHVIAAKFLRKMDLL